MSGSLASNGLWIFAGLIFASAAISYWNSSRKKKRSLLQLKADHQDYFKPSSAVKLASAPGDDKKPAAAAVAGHAGPHIDTLQSTAHVKGKVLEG